ncbi:hypothetical protein Pmani_035186 [Petrolisthes manimaculis]|uniref:Uncharacterized protein n=1 Tax=Petrolisthes manimaculis TaxID=1843537 RepID=A0AAE1TNF9_9EUCA|nr:hypothetical protein Pmani_035186 [Petrolisthes manimaculis]
MGVVGTLMTLGLLLGMVTAQLPFSVMPSISEAVKTHVSEDPGGSAWSFVRLWQYSLDQDGQGPSPANKVNFGYPAPDDGMSCSGEGEGEGEGAWEGKGRCRGNEETGEGK